MEHLQHHGINDAARILGESLESGAGDGLKAVATAIETYAVVALAGALITSGYTRTPEYAMTEARRAVNFNG